MAGPLIASLIDKVIRIEQNYKPNPNNLLVLKDGSFNQDDLPPLRQPLSRRNNMTLCPIALAITCEKCMIFKPCPLKGIVGDYKKEEAQKETPPENKSDEPPQN